MLVVGSPRSAKIGRLHGRILRQELTAGVEPGLAWLVIGRERSVKVARVSKVSLTAGALVAGAAGFVGTATPAAALPASSWNIGLGLCTAKSALTNNAYPASMSAAALNNFPHGSVHKSDADMPGWPGYTGADTHVYSSYKAGSQWSCRWVDFTSHADGATRSYHCLVVGATSYKGTASRPYTPDPHPSAAVVDISNAALETYWCD